MNPVTKRTPCGCGGTNVLCHMCDGYGSFPEKRERAEPRRYDDRISLQETALLRAHIQDAEAACIDLTAALNQVLPYLAHRSSCTYGDGSPVEEFCTCSVGKVRAAVRTALAKRGT